jgi:hypothetical protein
MLLDEPAADGSRLFARLPQAVLWHRLRDHVAELPGAVVTAFVTDDVTEAWIDFTYRGHSFSVNDQFGEYWFFVRDPGCPESILGAVVDHCATIL